MDPLIIVEHLDYEIIDVKAYIKENNEVYTVVEYWKDNLPMHKTFINYLKEENNETV